MITSVSPALGLELIILPGYRQFYSRTHLNWDPTTCHDLSKRQAAQQVQEARIGIVLLPMWERRVQHASAAAGPAGKGTRSCVRSNG